MILSLIACITVHHAIKKDGSLTISIVAFGIAAAMGITAVSVFAAEFERWKAEDHLESIGLVSYSYAFYFAVLSTVASVALTIWTICIERIQRLDETNVVHVQFTNTD